MNSARETTRRVLARQSGARSSRGAAVAGIVRHVFTHFPLELSVYATELPADVQAPEGMRWIPMADIAGEALPSLMRKVIAHAVR